MTKKPSIPDTQQCIGRLLPSTAQRDAIHIAVAPVVADQPMLPGAVIGLSLEGRAIHASPTVPTVGIVDPFLTTPVQPGDRVYCFLTPNTITSLRHEWTHPAFPDATSTRQASQRWLTKLAAQVGYSYEEFIAALETDDVVLGSDASADRLEELRDEIARHYEAVYGRRLELPEFFRCSC
jgi:hypothetical protein